MFVIQIEPDSSLMKSCVGRNAQELQLSKPKSLSASVAASLQLLCLCFALLISSSMPLLSKIFLHAEHISETIEIYHNAAEINFSDALPVFWISSHKIPDHETRVLLQQIRLRELLHSLNSQVPSSRFDRTCCFLRRPQTQSTYNGHDLSKSKQLLAIDIEKI